MVQLCQRPLRGLVVLGWVAALRLVVAGPVVVVVDVRGELLHPALLPRHLEGLAAGPPRVPAALCKVAVVLALVSRHLDDVLHPVGLHREGAARDAHHRHAAAEVAHQLVDLHGRGHQDDPEVGSLIPYLPQQEQQQVAVGAPLVDLVDEDVRHAGERCEALLHLLQEHAHRAEEQPRGVRGALLQADLVAHHGVPGAGASRRVPHLLRHALGDGDRGDAARLGDDDAGQGASAVLQQGVLENVLRHLRGLAAAGGAADHHDIVGPQKAQQRVAGVRHRQTRTDPLNLLEARIAQQRVLPSGVVRADLRCGLSAELHELVVLAGLRPHLAAAGLGAHAARLDEGLRGRLRAQHPLQEEDPALGELAPRLAQPVRGLLVPLLPALSEGRRKGAGEPWAVGLLGKLPQRPGRREVLGVALGRAGLAGIEGLASAPPRQLHGDARLVPAALRRLDPLVRGDRARGARLAPDALADELVQALLRRPAVPPGDVVRPAGRQHLACRFGGPLGSPGLRAAVPVEEGRHLDAVPVRLRLLARAGALLAGAAALCLLGGLRRAACGGRLRSSRRRGVSLACGKFGVYLTPVELAVLPALELLHLSLDRRHPRVCLLLLLHVGADVLLERALLLLLLQRLADPHQLVGLAADLQVPRSGVPAPLAVQALPFVQQLVAVGVPALAVLHHPGLPELSVVLGL
mmetsp:Transcript_37497/g.116519  ORF Transcript_37497/g.116519 Transcript_37497/m.116519 type:complete len:691 (+) Transcript_37497:1799-3871(+)